MPEELIVGRRYRVTYRLQGQRKDRVLVGKYMGWSRFYSKHAFDLRPEHGTTELFGDDILKVELIEKGA